jgi:hypothetical protein
MWHLHDIILGTADLLFLGYVSIKVFIYVKRQV